MEQPRAQEGDNMADSTLPPLPGSDAETLQRNPYHSFYKVRAREFWQDAEVTHHKLEDFRKCNHFFERQSDDIRCKKCHIGWLAPRESLEVRDGQLYLNNNHIQL